MRRGAFLLALSALAACAAAPVEDTATPASRPVTPEPLVDRIAELEARNQELERAQLMIVLAPCLLIAGNDLDKCILINAEVGLAAGATGLADLPDSEALALAEEIEANERDLARLRRRLETREQGDAATARGQKPPQPPPAN
ncbi:MAG: hypothetical protein AAGF44_04575 [Pseudomonadota bacterium]